MEHELDRLWDTRNRHLVPRGSAVDYKETLPGRAPDEYGASYEAHTLEIYKTYLEMADRISSRRQSANSYFLTINTALIGLVSYLGFNAKSPGVEAFLPMGLAGAAISYLWYRIIRSYRDLNSAKFKVFHEIEKQLPLRPYDAEWDAAGRGDNPKLYLPFTHIEIAVPWVFIALHLYLAARVIPWARFVSDG